MGLWGLRGLEVVVRDRAIVGPAFAQGDHLGPKLGVRGKHSVIAMAMDTWWRKQSRQPLEQLHGRQDEDAPPVGCRTGEPVDESGIRRSQRLVAAYGVEPVEREGWSGTVADEPLEAVAVVPLDADRGVDAESTRALPREHVGGGGLVEEIVTAEIPEAALLDRALELLPVPRFELGSLVEVHATFFGLREDPVEDDDVVVEVGVEAGPEAVQKRDGADLALGYRRRSPGTCGVQGGADRTEEDSKDAACHLGIVMEVGSQPFRHREHPLPDRKPGHDPIGQVGCDLGHPAGVAGGTDTSPLAAEGPPDTQHPSWTGYSASSG